MTSSYNGKLWSICQRLNSAICRKKTPGVDPESTDLVRCLGVFELTLLATGGMVGSGIYLFIGQAISERAGPAIILAFLIAAIPSFIAALCFAELGARMPKSGSTYDYIYASLGEFWAALIAWYVVTGPVFWAPAQARAWSAYFDSMLNGWIANHTVAAVGRFNSPFLSEYPDFLAAGLVLFASLVVAAGAKMSTRFNSFFAIVNFAVMAFVVGYGLSMADVGNWTDPKYGQFFPFGIRGIIIAAPTCIFAYGGFEAATTAGEEAKNPKRTIVISIILAFVIVTCAYVLMCVSITLMLPYNQISPTSSFSEAFAKRGAYWARYVVAVGALCSLTTTMFNPLFSGPRFVHAVANDGLIFRWLAVVNPCTKVPLRPIMIYVPLMIIVVLVFDLTALLEFLSMGGILSYVMICGCVTILRYTPTADHPLVGTLKPTLHNKPFLSLLSRYRAGNVVVALMSIHVITMIAWSAIVLYADWRMNTAQFYVYCVLTVLLSAVLLICPVLIFCFVQRKDDHLWFQVPLVPFLPAISMLINVMMIMNLTPFTWLRFGAYTVIGALLYFGYGFWHSALRTFPSNNNKGVDTSWNVQRTRM